MASSQEIPVQAQRKLFPESIPGASSKTSTNVMESGVSMIQNLKPMSNFKQHVCTWAMYSQDMKRVIETHHHVSRLNEDILQCVVFDSNEVNAKLLGVEYIVSERIFSGLPDEEKKLWHSHYYEISSGLWINPGVPEMLQKQELKTMGKTYGKFWLMWQADRGDNLPLGTPALMMSPQEKPPGLVPKDMVENRDTRYQVSSEEKRESRRNLEPPNGGVDPLSDYWKDSNHGWETKVEPCPLD